MTLNFPFSSFFMFNLIFSSLFTISSYSWLGVWTGLEYNLISFIPLMMSNPTPASTESAIKYFIVQAFSSAMLLLSLLTSSSLPFSALFVWLTIMALSIKMGIAPFHQWVPNVTSSMSWMNIFILLSWQKLAPLSLMAQYLNPQNSKLIIFMGAVSAMVGGLGGLNQTQMRTILAFSSIGHMGWIISAITVSTCDKISALAMK